MSLPICLDCKVKLKDYRSERCIKCAHQGKNHPCYGKKQSQETIEKRRLANKGNSKCGWSKGKHLSEKHKESISQGQLKRVKEGKHNFCKGGIYPIDLLARTKFRSKIKKLILERDDYTCQLCGVKGGILQVDHIQSWSKYVELRFELSNCRTICMECHYFITYNKPMPKNVKAYGHTFKQIEILERRIAL